MFNIESLALPIAIGVSAIVYCLEMFALPKGMFSGEAKHLKKVITQIENTDYETETSIEREDPVELMLERPLVRAFMLIPGTSKLLPMLQNAGLAKKVDTFFLAAIVLFVLLVAATSSLGAIGIVVSFLLTAVLMLAYLNKKIHSQKKKALALFPDALDMIVRSVRAGYPINTALNIVAENVPFPLNAEFKRIIDEISLGTTLADACARFAERMDDDDMRFFAIVVSIQSDSGGNISEVFENISRVLRQRVQLRLRIRALSSEGRASAWILGGLIVFLVCTLSLIAPDHLKPLFYSSMGHNSLMIVAVMMTVGVLMIRKIINVEI